MIFTAILSLIALCCLAAVAVLSARDKENKNKIAELKNELLLKGVREKGVEAEFRSLGEIINKRTVALEEQKNLTVQSSRLAALGEMAAGIAHEINNPLTIIGSSNQKIQRILASDEVDLAALKKYSSTIENTVGRITKIVSGLKNISRDSANETFAPTKLFDIFNDINSLCSERYRVNGNNLIINLEDPVLQTEINCLRVQFSQVILNLITNAYDAIAPLKERWIKIECEIKTDLIIRIMDSGRGIPLDVQDKIFQPFYTTKEIGKGTGLGLSISKGIIKNHKGEFFIDNASANTCFVIVMPLIKKKV